MYMSSIGRVRRPGFPRLGFLDCWRALVPHAPPAWRRGRRYHGVPASNVPLRPVVPARAALPLRRGTRA